MTRLRKTWGSIVAAWVLSGCLPADTRPPPGKLLIRVAPDDALIEGIPADRTDDGWSIRFDRLLLSLGHVSAEGDSCVSYSDPEYSRVLDMTWPKPQKLSLLYAIGSCGFDFELSSPHEDSVLAESATEQDKTLLRLPGTDRFALESGTSIYVEGTAQKQGVRKHFAWAYRHRIDYGACHPADSDVGFELATNESKTLDLLVRGAALFPSSLDVSESAIGFQLFADADTRYGNDDGEVTLAELDAVPLDELHIAERFADAGIATDEWMNLGDYVYLGLFPRLIQFPGDGECKHEVFPNNRTAR